MLHQITLMAQVADVTVLDSTDVIATGHDIIARLRRRLSGPRLFRERLREQLAKSPDICIAFDAEAISAMLTLPKGRELRVAHLHEHPSLPDLPRFSAMHSATRNTLARLRSADLVTVPDAHRAALLVSDARLEKEPMVIMNCPMTIASIPESKLIPWLAARGVSAGATVHYQGSVGPDHCLENVILSMRLWPDDAVFVIVGRGDDKYIESLKSLAVTNNVGARVFFVGHVPYPEVLSYAVGATVGVSLLDPSLPNWKFSAGASNKRFEYVALGIPQVTNEGPGINELFAQRDVCKTARFDSSDSIGHAIATYLREPELRTRHASSARQLHLAEYNYEKQFNPALKYFQTALGLGA